MDDLYNDMVSKGLVTPIEFGYLTVNQCTFNPDKFRPMVHGDILAYTGYTYREVPITDKTWRWS